jgi:hypothetical protein
MEINVLKKSSTSASSPTKESSPPKTKAPKLETKDYLPYLIDLLIDRIPRHLDYAGDRFTLDIPESDKICFRINNVSYTVTVQKEGK